MHYSSMRRQVSCLLQVAGFSGHMQGGQYTRALTRHQPGQLLTTVMPREVSAGSAACSFVPCSTAALVMLYSRYTTPRSVRGSGICGRWVMWVRDTDGGHI